MCANDTELTYDSLLTDPLIRLVMRSDGVNPAQLAALLRRAALARDDGDASPSARPRLALVHSTALPLPLLAEAPTGLRPAI